MKAYSAIKYPLTIKNLKIVEFDIIKGIMNKNKLYSIFIDEFNDFSKRVIRVSKWVYMCIKYIIIYCKNIS